MKYTDENHPYSDPKYFERVTPIEDIPVEYRYNAPIKGGFQVVDIRLTYNWNGERQAYVECGSVSSTNVMEEKSI